MHGGLHEVAQFSLVKAHRRHDTLVFAGEAPLSHVTVQHADRQTDRQTDRQS